MASKKSQNNSPSVFGRRKDGFQEQDVLAARKCLEEMAARPMFSLREVRQAIAPDIAKALHRGVQADQVSEALEALGVRVSASFVRGLRGKKKPNATPDEPQE